jgi:small-conductance mechanosensitive channel
VELDGVQLFRVAGSASFPSERRALDVRARIVDAARDPGIAAKDIQVVRRDTRIDVTARGKHLVAAVDADAALEGVPVDDVAQMRALRIQEAIARYRADRAPAQLGRAALTVGIISAIAIVVFLLLQRAFRFAFRWIEQRYRGRIQAVKVHSFELVRAESIWHAINGILRALRIVVLIAFSYAFLYLTLQEFPWTRGFANRLTQMIGEPLEAMAVAALGYLPKLIFLVFLAIATRYLLRIISIFSTALAAGKVSLQGFDADWAQPTYNIVRALVVLLALVVAYPYLPGSGSAAFQGLSIFAGLVFSLGASSAMSSIIAGYTLTYRRAFRIGDRIKIGDLVGEVTQVRLLVTQLRTEKNEEVVLPNSMVLSSHIVNFSKLAADHGLILHAHVGIGYATPWRQVEALLLMAADRTEGVSKSPRPFVLERGLGDFAVNYEVNAYVSDAIGIPRRYAALHRNILDVFNEYGVQIMTPAYEGDPEQPKIVRTEDWYTIPATAPATPPARASTDAESPIAPLTRERPDAA